MAALNGMGPQPGVASSGFITPHFDSSWITIGFAINVMWTHDWTTICIGIHSCVLTKQKTPHVQALGSATTKFGQDGPIKIHNKI